MNFFTRLGRPLLFAAAVGFSMMGCGGDNGAGPSSDVAVSGVTLDRSTLSMTVGGTETLTATVSPSGATNKKVGWTTSNPSVATVTYGVINAVGAGSATITVVTEDGGRTAQCVVTVTGGTAQPTYSLDGIWTAGGAVITVSGNSGIFSSIITTKALWLDAINKGYVKAGTTQFWRNLTSTGNLTWSGQELQVTYNTSNPNVAIGTQYYNVTITMSANGQTITVISTDSNGSQTFTYTRQR